MKSTFKCAKCGQIRLIRGRTKYKPSGTRDSLDRIVWLFQCAECTLGLPVK